MRFLLIVSLIPLLLVPAAAVGLHFLACGIHVTSVDRMLDKQATMDRLGRFYGYCKFMAAPLRDIV